MAKFTDWVNKNVRSEVSGAGLLFNAPAIASIAAADNKLKALSKTIAGIVLWKPLIAIGLVGAFSALSKGIRTVLADTGSLQAAMQKLARIQGFQKMFDPLVGGAEAAKRKVAELVNFAAKFKVFRFEDVAQGARSLQVFTRGAFTTAQALKIIGDSAAKSGNSFMQVSDAVGAFYAALRTGAPVGDAAEQLRQMGVISDAAADKLTGLQQGGAGMSQIFKTLTDDLAQANGGMEAMRDSIEGVNTAYEEASKNLQEQFGSPFVEADVTNTKNYTDAINALAPAIGKAAGAMAKFNQPFSNIKSAITKAIAENKIVQGGVAVAGEAAGPAAAATTVGAGLYLGKVAKQWIGKGESLAGKGLEKLTTAFPVLEKVAPSVARGIGLVATALRAFTVIGLAAATFVASFKLGTWIGEITGAHEAIKRWTGQVTEADEALQKTTAAIADQVSALSKQARAVETLTQKQEAHAAALATIKNLQDQMASAKTPEERAAAGRGLRSANRQLSAINAKTNLYSEEQKSSFARDEALAPEERMAALQRRLENALPGGRTAPLEDIAIELDRRAQEAERGVNDRAASVGLTDDQIFAKTASGSSVNLDARARQARANGYQDTRALLEARAETARQREGDAGGLRLEASRASEALPGGRAEDAVTQARIKAEAEINNLKSIGFQRSEDEYKIKLAELEAEKKAISLRTDLSHGQREDLRAQAQSGINALTIGRREGRRGFAVDTLGGNRDVEKARAQLGGRWNDATRLSNLDEFARNYEQRRNLGDKNAGANALTLTQASIAAGAAQPIASHLARIGLGGEVGAGDATKELLQVQKDAATYLQQIRDNLGGGSGGNVPMDESVNAPI